MRSRLTKCLATLGAQVLHNRSVEMAKKYNIDLEVVSSLTRNPGTKVKEVTSVEKMIISGVACDKDTAQVTVCGLPDEPGRAFRVFSLLANNKINVDIILQTSVNEAGTKHDISFTVATAYRDEAVRILEENKDRLHFDAVTSQTNLAKVSVVGAGMVSNPGVAARMFEALSDAQVNILMIATSEIKISVVIDAADSGRALRAVHEKFFE